MLHVALGLSIPGWGSWQASLLALLFGRHGSTEALFPHCLSWHGLLKNAHSDQGGRIMEKRRFSNLNYHLLIVKGETCGEGSGSTGVCRFP